MRHEKLDDFKAEMAKLPEPVRIQWRKSWIKIRHNFDNLSMRDKIEVKHKQFQEFLQSQSYQI